jgi:ABC-2 type transport system permease protein
MKFKFFSNIRPYLSMSRFKALIIKELSQLFRNKAFLFFITFPPTIQLCLYGFVLSPNVENIKLGIIDHSKTFASREFISAFTENKTFVAHDYIDSQKNLGELVREGKLSAGLVIPPDFARNLHSDKIAEVQFFLDGVDAYTAGIASSYIAQITYRQSLNLMPEKINPLINPQIILLYNKGLVNSWFFVFGVMGMIMTFTTSLSAASESIREKETGTLEQLLMTPASSIEILLAKIVPMFVVFMGVISICLIVAKLIFGIPLQGNILLFMGLSALYIIIGISIGLLIGTFSRNSQQAILTGLFVILPMTILSGAITPVESMPTFFRYVSLFNPLTHYIAIIKGILMKGVGLDILWKHSLALLIFAITLLSISSYRFRSQL